jgi:hypothetical protein
MRGRGEWKNVRDKNKEREELRQKGEKELEEGREKEI